MISEFFDFAEPGLEFVLFFCYEEGVRSAVFELEDFGNFLGRDATGSRGNIELGDVEGFDLLCNFP